MRFESDLIRYIIDLAISRRVFAKSKDLNADWLPFTTIAEVFFEVCRKMGVAKEIESRCYKALEKMSSSDERHVTWSYKVKNISTYLPATTSTHAAKHTSSSWTKHKPRDDGKALSASSTPELKAKPRSQRDSGAFYDDRGLNLGRLSERTFQRDFQQYHSSPTSKHASQFATDEQRGSGTKHAPSPDDYAMHNILSELAEEQRTRAAAERAHWEEPLPEQHAQGAGIPPILPTHPPVPHTPQELPAPPSTHYYRDYVPSSRWPAQNVPPTSPQAALLHSHGNSSGKNSTIPSPSHGYIPSPALRAPYSGKIRSNEASSGVAPQNTGPFSDAQLLAMQQRVEAMEREARKTRTLLANIAYLKDTSTGARLDSEEASTAGVLQAEGQEDAWLGHHQHHVEFGEIPLSPYLQSVLHLPAALVTTDLHEEPVPVTPPAGPSRQHTHHRSPLSSRTPDHSPRSAERQKSPVDSSLEAAGFLWSEYSHRNASEVRTPRSSSQPPKRSATSPRSDSGNRTSAPDAAVQASPQSEFSSSLRCSEAMKKYLELTSHRTAGADPVSSSNAGMSPSAQANPRSPTQRFSVNTNTPISPIQRQSPSSSSPHHSSPHYPVPGHSPYSHSHISHTSHALHATHGSNAVQMVDSPGQQRYHNSFRAQQQADACMVTTIDSRIDELLGDSLNIEEKDGRVYVHFQSKFLLS